MTTRFLFPLLILLVAAFTGCSKPADSTAAATSQHEVANFATDVVTRSETSPVLVDFWAPWCGPCRTLSPVIEKAAADATGRWTLVTVNVDNHGDLAEQYGIQSIPNVKLFHQGKVIAGFVGVKSEASLRAWLEANLPK